jgi:hypothetical protein
MEQLKISTGKIAIQILDDDGEVRGVFKFNPEDIKSARKIADLIEDYKTKSVEYSERAKLIETPEENVRLLDEVVDYFKTSLDSVYGDGTSMVLFGNASTLEMFDDFFAGITPYYEKASKQRKAKFKATK